MTEPVYKQALHLICCIYHEGRAQEPEEKRNLWHVEGEDTMYGLAHTGTGSLIVGTLGAVATAAGATLKWSVKLFKGNG